MDLSAYINSGILELYVLDRLAPDERRRVESYAAEYPEVKSEIEHIELDLERYAVLHGAATPPAPAVLDRVLREIQPTAASPATSTPTTPPPATAAGGSGALTWILLIALALAAAGLIYYYLQSQDRGSEMEGLSQRYDQLEAACQQQASEYEADQQQLALLTDIDTRGVILAGTDNAPDSRARVFYNPDRQSVLFTASNLPAPPAGRQYQLWAINGDGPQDLGVLDLDLTSEELLDVPFVAGAAAFAITLEEAGGKPSPDLTQLQVIGEVGS